MKKVLLLLLIIFVIAPVTWFLFNQFERSTPEVKVEIPPTYLPRSYAMEMNIKEKGTGLRKVIVSITQNGKEKILIEKEYPLVGYSGFFLGSGANSDNFSFNIESRKYGMGDGEALISVKVSDYSWWGWNSGNVFSVDKKVIIDTRAPEVEVLSKTHNVSRGGAGLVIYRVTEDGDVVSGVQVGDHFYRGYSGMFDQKDVYVSFFALSHQQGPGTEIFVKAEDKAGNVAKRGFYHYIKEKKFRSDTLDLSDSFLQSIDSQFNLGEIEATFDSTDNPPLNKFLYINQKLRAQNSEKILQPVSESEPARLWEGTFLRLPGAAPRAQFADHRFYKYGGKLIDQQYHLGVDLASIAHSDIPAANNGKVILVDNIGIFGKCVVIDHGFGVCSSYAHMSNISVKVGDMVKKGDIIGQTGSTGLAVGDHLHFGMSIADTFVNPLEWWDPAWIKNNIDSKINEAKQELSKK